MLISILFEINLEIGPAIGLNIGLEINLESAIRHDICPAYIGLEIQRGKSGKKVTKMRGASNLEFKP